VTDGRWRLIEPSILLPRPGGRLRTLSMRELINGIFHLVPDGLLVAAEKGDRGYGVGKKVPSRKRYVIVDTLGLILALAVHPANLRDRERIKLVLRRVPAEYPLDERSGLAAVGKDHSQTPETRPHGRMVEIVQARRPTRSRSCPGVGSWKGRLLGWVAAAACRRTTKRRSNPAGP